MVDLSPFLTRISTLHWRHATGADRVPSRRGHVRAPHGSRERSGASQSYAPELRPHPQGEAMRHRSCQARGGANSTARLSGASAGAGRHARPQCYDFFFVFPSSQLDSRSSE